MSSLWQLRISKEEGRRLEEWWERDKALRMARGEWPPKWPKMTEERLEKRRKRLEKKYGKR